MQSRDIWSVAAAIVVSFGGATLIVAVLVTWLGRVWANRILESDRSKFASELETLKSRFVQDTERHKTALKKSELIFEKEFQAASAFVALVRSIRPRTTRPDMDWDDACDEIALGFEQHEVHIDAYLAEYGAILPDAIRDKLASCAALASEGKFNADGPRGVDPQWNKYASEFFADLLEIEKALIAQVRSQTSS